MIATMIRRLALMGLTALALTFLVFVFTNLAPNLEKLAKSAGTTRMSDAAVASWLEKNGYARPMLVKYGEWLGALPGWQRQVEKDDQGGAIYRGRCWRGTATAQEAAQKRRYCGVLQGNWGWSTRFQDDVVQIIGQRLGNTGVLMGWVLLLMVPGALAMGIVAGMREGSTTDRAVSSLSILSSATPEYVSGVILIAVFASSSFGLKWFKGTATSAMEQPTFENFFLPVLTIALYGMGYIARMTRASMAEVMTAQYIRTARLKGVGFGRIVLVHALRNALIAPFTVIMLQFPWLLNGVVIVETLFNYKGFGWALVEAAGNNDIELLLAISVVSVVVVLLTQMLSDLGYVLLNPRLRLG